MNRLRYFFFMLVGAVLFGMVTTLATLFYLLPVIQKSRPMGYWFDVRSMEVFNAFEGQCPVVMVDRTIHLDFNARWTAKLWIKTNRGRWITYLPLQPPIHAALERRRALRLPGRAARGYVPFLLVRSRQQHPHMSMAPHWGIQTHPYLGTRPPVLEPRAAEKRRQRG